MGEWSGTQSIIRRRLQSPLRQWTCFEIELNQRRQPFRDWRRGALVRETDLVMRIKLVDENLFQIHGCADSKYW